MHSEEPFHHRITRAKFQILAQQMARRLQETRGRETLGHLLPTTMRERHCGNALDLG